MTLHIELPGLASVIILVCISYQQTIQKKWFCSYKICDMKFVIRHERCQINKLRQVQKMHILDKNVILCCVGFICFLTKISYFHAIALLWKILKLKMIALCLFFFFFLITNMISWNYLCLNFSSESISKRHLVLKLSHYCIWLNKFLLHLNLSQSFVR